MQVANALNNTIRILFNPKIEAFKLFDFLIVKSQDDRYLAQITEIYDDKFDSSQNVARLRLFYKITQNNEVMPYDNFTPNKECEISKVKPDEIENFINSDKKTFIFATNAKNSQGLNIQYDFFNRNAIIMADKIENATAVSLNLAKKLSTQKHTVLVDFTGIIEFEEAKKIKACKNFKMPLNYSTIELAFNRCLADASLEFQAIGLEIMNAIMRYAKKQELGFIPFNAFVNVILEQYKATPYPELQLLLARMRKYQMNDIFAKNKKDYESLSKTIEKNEITIIDLSGFDKVWQKAYVEYIISELKQEVYLITRINDELFDTDLINKIYNEKKNIKFVPNVSYNYSKLPSIMQYCKNYILMPSLNQRNDFLDANFALANLIAEGCIIFGENTDNFIYLARDYELDVQEKRKNYRKIALSMANSADNDYIQEEQVSDSQRLMNELSDLEEQQEQDAEQEQYSGESTDEFQEIESHPQAQEVPMEVETIKNIQEIKLSNVPPQQEVVEQQTVIEHQNIRQEEKEFNQETEKEVTEVQKASDENNEQEQTEIKEPEIIQENQEVSESLNEQIEKYETVADKELDISDEELDFFELSESSAKLSDKENVIIDDIEYKVKSDNSENNINELSKDDNEDDDLDLSELASNAIDNNFEEIINAKVKDNKPTFEIDENTSIQVDLNEAPKENLPIFKDEDNNSTNSGKKYKTGDIIIHGKYGRGEIIKIIEHDQRQLLQINFENESTGPKLLDPKISEIQPER